MPNHCNNINCQVKNSRNEKKPFKFSFTNWSDSEEYASIVSLSENSEIFDMSSSLYRKPICYDEKAIVTSVCQDVFTVQLKERIPQMLSFLNKLQKLGEKAKPLSNFEKGVHCIVKNPFCGNWIRAKIVDSNIDEENTLISIENVDNGCTYSFENKNELKTYPTEALFKEYYGVKFMLPLKIYQESRKYFNQYMLQMVNETISYKIICKLEHAYVVDVIYENVNIVNELLRENIAVKLKYLPNSLVEVVNVRSLNEFYIHFDKDENWKKITIEVLKYKKKQIEEVPKIGTLIMVRNIHCCSEGCWHRGELKSRFNENLEVLLIDFGCTMKVSQNDIGAMDKNIAKLKPVAHRCSLFFPKGVHQTDQAIKMFRKVALEKDFYINTIRAEEDRTIVSLINSESRDLATLIMPYCEKIFDLEISSELSAITEESSSLV